MKPTKSFDGNVRELLSDTRAVHSIVPRYAKTTVTTIGISAIHAASDQRFLKGRPRVFATGRLLAAISGKACDLSVPITRQPFSALAKAFCASSTDWFLFQKFVMTSVNAPCMSGDRSISGFGNWRDLSFMMAMPSFAHMSN